MTTLTTLWAWVRSTAHDTSKRTTNERGATTLEWILIAAGVAAIAIAAVAIIRAKVIDTAQNIPTG